MKIFIDKIILALVSQRVKATKSLWLCHLENSYTAPYPPTFNENGSTLLCGIIMQHILLIFYFFPCLHGLSGTARLFILLKNSYLHIYLELKIFHFRVKTVNFSRFYLKKYYYQTYWCANSLLHSIYLNVWPSYGIKTAIFLPARLLDFGKFSYLQGYQELHVY